MTRPTIKSANTLRSIGSSRDFWSLNVVENSIEFENGYVVGIFADDGRKFKSVYADQKIMSVEEFDACLKDAKDMSELAY